MARLSDQAWPSTVIPADDRERAQATRVLFERMGWLTKRLGPAERDDVARQLAFWYEAGYSPDALLVALDVLPDGGKQARIKPNESIAGYLRERLRAWYDEESSQALTPPRAGQYFEHWYANRKRQRREDGTDRRPAQLSEKGRQARAEAMAFAASKRRNPLERVRRAEQRRAEALARLRMDGEAPVLPATETPDTGTTPRMVAAYAGRQSVLADSPQITRILARLKEERRSPTDAELAVLRNAARDARRQAGVGTLEAASAEVTAEAGILSPAGMRILAYTDHANLPDLPLDAVLAMLRVAVDDQRS